MDYKLSKNVRGFTLIELLVSIGILMVIFALTTINLSPLPSNTLLTTNMDTLISDIRAQQALSMSGNTSRGVHFEAGSYTLFDGQSFVQGAATNFTVTLDPEITFTNILIPNDTLVFEPGSGDFANYASGSDRFTLGNSTISKSIDIKINKYGATY